jgi:hypothetical protein
LEPKELKNVIKRSTFHIKSLRTPLVCKTILVLVVQTLEILNGFCKASVPMYSTDRPEIFYIVSWIHFVAILNDPGQLQKYLKKKKS